MSSKEVWRSYEESEWWAALSSRLETRGVDSANLELATRYAAETDSTLLVGLTRSGVVSENVLLGELHTLTDLPITSLTSLQSYASIPTTLNERFLRHHKLVPLCDEEELQAVVCVDPFDTAAIEGLFFALQCTCPVHLTTETNLLSTLNRLATPNPNGPQELRRGRIHTAGSFDSESPAIIFVNGALTAAIDKGASDVHLESTEHGLESRIRIDGSLRLHTNTNESWTPRVVPRIKVMASMDSAETRLPQDGRCTVNVRGRSYDLRVSTIPSQYGESAVLRILGQAQVPLELEKLGLPEFALSNFRSAINKPSGLLLVTGPTGSGKSTTLYAALRELYTPSKKLLSVEDPVEYSIPGVVQTQVNPAIGMTFAAALRSFLRQDPDIIMVGEIRDLETAEISVRAALTGHLVLSTLHANSALSGLVRLRDMGVDEFLLLETVAFLSAQRLLRVLCTSCRYSRSLEVHERALFTDHDLAVPDLVYDARGCESCGASGYVGRRPVFEVIAMTSALKAACREGVATEELVVLAKQSGSTFLASEALLMSAAGDVSIGDALQLCGESV